MNVVALLAFLRQADTREWIMSTDWRHIYQTSQAHIRDQARGKFAVAAFFGLIGLALLAISVIMPTSSAMFVVLLVAAGALFTMAFLVWSGWSDGRGSPIVLVGQVCEKEQVVNERKTRRGETKTTIHYFLHLDISSIFRLTSHGQQQPLSGAPMRHKLWSEPRLYERLHEDEPVTLVCLPTGKAFARLEDLHPRGSQAQT
jgi:hypothetical protein